MSVGRLPSGVLQGIAAFAAYEIVFVFVFASAIAAHPGIPQLRQDWTDPNFYTWSIQWWPYALTHGLNPLYTHQVGAPHGYNLAWATTVPSVGIVMWPVTAVLGAVRSYNIVLLTVPPVSAWAAFICARRLTGRFWVALLAGSAYGFNAFELWHTLQGQPNLTVIGLFPLMVYLVLRWWDGSLRTPWFVAWLVAALAAEFYTFSEAFADLTLVGAGAVVIGYLVAGRDYRPKALELTKRLAVAYLGAILLAGPYLYYALRHQQSSLVRQAPIYSLNPLRMLVPSPEKLTWFRPLWSYSFGLGPYSVDDYVGIGLVLVLAAVAVRSWRTSRLTRLLVLVFIFVFALAIGPGVPSVKRQLFGVPWGFIWSLPLLRSAEPSRIVIFLYLILSLALALWLAGLPAPAPAPTPTPDPVPDGVHGQQADAAMGGGTRVGRQGAAVAARWTVGILALAIAFADLPTFSGLTAPLPKGYKLSAGMRPTDQLPAFLTAGLYRRYLQPGETVVVVTRRGNAGMLFQADANFYFKIAGGFINTSMTPQDALPPQVEALTNPTGGHVAAFRHWAEHNHIGAILVEQRWAETWTKVFGRIGLHGTSAGGVTVYPVSPR